MSQVYIGDSVYVTFDGYGLILTTNNGLGPTNTIYLEPEVYESLAAYVKSLQAERKQNAREEVS